MSNYYKHDKCQTLVSVRTWRAITIHTTFIDSSSQWHQIVLIVQQALIRSSSNRFLPVLADSQLLNVKVLISVLQLLFKRLFESHLWKLIMKSDSVCVVQIVTKGVSLICCTTECLAPKFRYQAPLGSCDCCLLLLCAEYLTYFNIHFSLQFYDKRWQFLFQK